jgi:hypothetical protein
MLMLPTWDGGLEAFAPRGTPLVARAPRVALTRTAFAAAHVVVDPLRMRDPWDARPVVDWQSTLAFRHYLWDQGLGLAEAMDTAQRGMGVDWATALELIRLSLRDARIHPLRPRVACGAGTDHLSLADLSDAAGIAAAYETQAEAIEAEGGQLILMASRAFPAIGAGPDTYRKVYRRLIDGAARPVILHWLGEMFDPALAGYWGSRDVAEATEFVLSLIAENPGKVDGIKISLLDQAHEEAFRARLPAGVRLYTGDDFNYAPLIEGDGTRHSHALLGIFAAIAPAAAQALEALAQGDTAAYHALLAPTVPLSRQIFRSPTRYYKAGIVFLAWLNGHQDHFTMAAGLHSSRDITHYAEIFRLADAAGLLAQPDLALSRMAGLLALHGIGQGTA